MRESNTAVVSVVITTCDRPKDVLMRAVSSVENQTYSQIELIVVNDASCNTEELERTFCGRSCKGHEVLFLSNLERKGACASRNLGISKATGRYLALLDDDDEWLPTKLEKQVAAMRDGIGLVYSNFVVKSDTIDIKPDKRKQFYEGDILEPLLGSNFIGGCSVPLMNLSMVKEAGMFDSNFPSSQDYDLWIRMAAAHQTAYVDETLSVYYVGSLSITGSFERRMTGWNQLLDKYRELYDKYPRARMQFVSVMINEAAKRQHIPDAFRMLMGSFLYFPHNMRCIYTFLKGILERIFHKY